MRNAFRVRVRLLAGAVVVVAVVLVLKLYVVAVIQGEAYVRQAEGQYVHTTRELFERGSIFFTDKTGAKVAAASQKTGFVLVANPSVVDDVDALYEALATHVPLERERFYMQLSKKDDPYEELAHELDTQTAERVRALALPGVKLLREQWRFYAGERLAAHTLGFVGFDEGGVVRSGRYGLERYWNDVLTRESSSLQVNFFAELFSNVRDHFSAKRHARAGDIVTTLDPSVQMFVEDTLTKTHEKWAAKELGAIVMDPATGAIVAMAGMPAYDPNRFNEEKDLERYRNKLVESVREMGSTIKPIAMAIGIDAGAVNAATTFNDTGSVEIDGYTIRNYDGRARGMVTMQDVLNQSLNTGMAFVARSVGRKEFGARMKAFGFGEETGIDLPYEAHGLVDNLDAPREVEHATAAFGQGIAMTPIATVRALAALGNGGLLVTPHLIKRIEYESGEVSTPSFAGEERRVISERASEEITRMLVEVVDSSLRGGTVKKAHYAIAAKTGTAQIAKTGERGYYDDRYLHSFFGYFPAYDPRFIIFLYHVEPQGAQYASETLTDPFMDIADFLINYYAIPPDR